MWFQISDRSIGRTFLTGRKMTICPNGILEPLHKTISTNRHYELDSRVGVLTAPVMISASGANLERNTTSGSTASVCESTYTTAAVVSSSWVCRAAGRASG